MSLSRNIGQYNDIKEVFDLALANGGGKYHLASPKHTIRWRQRAYMFRKLLREELVEKRAALGFSTATPYDEILITLDGASVILTISKMTGTFEPLAGGIPLPAANTPDELESEAERLVRELGA